MKEIPFFVPPLPEQPAIVRFLGHVDRRIRRYIRAKQKLIKLLEEQKQAIIHRAVTRGLDPNVRLKPSGVEWLGDVPEHWEVRRLKHFAAVNPARRNPSLQRDTLVTFLPMERVGEWGELDKHETVRYGESKSGLTYMQDGDIIVAKITPCFENGKGALCSELKNGVAMGSTEFHVLRPYGQTAGSFLYLITRSPAVRYLGVQSMRGTAGQQRVPPDFLANLLIALPPIDEQHEITEYIKGRIKGEIAQFDLAINRMVREIALLREYRTRLIADVVTGKIDVREAAAQMPDEAEEPETFEEDEAAEVDEMTDIEEETDAY
jgi:type I restriction enzyme S subunit